MSRSRKKHPVMCIAYGCNTEFYRDRNRSTRNINKHNLRDLFAKHYLEDIADLIYTMKNNQNPSYNSWNEPTDGHWAATPQEIEKFKDEEWFKKLYRK